MQLKTWKERKLSLKNSSNELVSEKAECDLRAAGGSGNHYVPPTFVGSLGKPSLSTVNNPRQVVRSGAFVL